MRICSKNRNMQTSLPRLVDVIVACFLAYVTPCCIEAFQETQPWDGPTSHDPLEKLGLESEPQDLVCEEQQVRSAPGTYTYFSMGHNRYCSLYLAAPIDHVIDLQFTYFDVTCQDDGEVLLLDGWELDYKVFPSLDDHPHPLPLRLVPLCNDKPRRRSPYSTPSSSKYSSSPSSSSPSSSSSSSSPSSEDHKDAMIVNLDAPWTIEEVAEIQNYEAPYELTRDSYSAAGDLVDSEISLEALKGLGDEELQELGESVLGGEPVVAEEDVEEVIEEAYPSFLNNVYSSQQNVAQVQYIIPKMGQGFSIRVSFRKIHKPCNMMLLHPNYEQITLRNYGLRRNCTVMSMYPQYVRFLYINVGQKPRTSTSVFRHTRKRHHGLRTMCENDHGSDSVQLYQGTGISSTDSSLVLGFCGVRQTPAPRDVKLGCQSSFLRLESSGHYYNMVRFSFLPFGDHEESTC